MLVAAAVAVAGLILCLVDLGRGALPLVVFGLGVLLLGAASRPAPSPSTGPTAPTTSSPRGARRGMVASAVGSGEEFRQLGHAELTGGRGRLRWQERGARQAGPGSGCAVR
jgi:hypothetical protein